MMIPCKLYVWCMILFTIVDVWYIFCQLFWWLIKINTMINNTVWIHTNNYKYDFVWSKNISRGNYELIIIYIKVLL